MKIRRNIRMTSEPNMAASSDIAFLLIIFFMVTSGFIFKDGLQMVLPDKSKKPEVIKDQKITNVTIDSAGIISLNKKAITVELLKQELDSLIKSEPESIVLVKVDKEVPYQKVIEIVDLMKIVNVKRLSMKMSGGEVK